MNHTELSIVIYKPPRGALPTFHITMDYFLSMLQQNLDEIKIKLEAFYLMERKFSANTNTSH